MTTPCNCICCTKIKKKSLSLQPTLHTILPLEWEKDGTGIWSAKFLGISYKIYKYATADEHYDLWLDGGRCLAESVDSFEKAQAQAEAHYREQLEKCLEVYNG